MTWLSPRLVKWSFVAVPLAGVLELGAHVVQVRSTVPDADWEAARDAVKEVLKPADLLSFAPSWSEPVGRHFFGDELATLARMAPADEGRFPRAVEVSIRGKHRPAFETWRLASSRQVGKVTIRVYENPSYAPATADLVEEVAAGRAQVSTARGGDPCRFVTDSAQAGGLGFGPAVPRARYACAGTFVGVSVLADLDYAPRRCIYMLTEPGRPTTLRFPALAFGRKLVGHHALSPHAEREGHGPPVQLLFLSETGSVLGRAVHRDGESWKAFEFDTSALAGKRADLVVEVSTPAQRQYCFEAVAQ